MKIRAALCCLAASGFLLSACSDDSGTIDEPDESATSQAAEEEAEAQAFDPPKEFDAGAGVALPPEAVQSKMNTTGVNVQRLPVALVGTKAFIATAGYLQIVDPATGEAFPDVVPASGTPMAPIVTTGMVGENPYEAPLAVEAGGTSLLVAPFIVTGTDGNYDLDVVGVDAASGEVAFDVPVDLPSISFSGYPHAEAAGESGGVVVISVGDQYTVAFDTAAQAKVWEKASAPTVVTGDVVISSSPSGDYTYDAFAIADGSPRWQGKDIGLDDLYATYSIQAAGPNFFAVLGSNYTLTDGQLPYDMLFDAATGEPVAQDERDMSGVECRFDGQETVVCFYRGPDNWVAALDATTGEWLWDTETGVVGVNVTAVWHGVVYGVGANGPAALDARTGQDTGTAPGVAPYVVNEYAAVADTTTGTWGDGGVSVYPAIG
ncbi:PQQ-binding-like beta-propeller repeat protein [Glycomyces sp. NPDC047010]|uniref:outer membrane protein assembly factor BamB family protein n=1 Tax=Glycomyces sp. NPDC047010 TaxID=3155023 RepID=UPI0033D67C6E